MNKVVLIIIIEKIIDARMYAEYVERAREIIPAYNGEYIISSNKILSLSGDKPERVVVISFDSIAAAKTCLSSPEYIVIKHLRENSIKSRAFFVEN